MCSINCQNWACTRNLGSMPPIEEKKKSSPKDVFGRLLPTEEQFEVLNNAPSFQNWGIPIGEHSYSESCGDFLGQKGNLSHSLLQPLQRRGRARHIDYGGKTKPSSIGNGLFPSEILQT